MNKHDIRWIQRLNNYKKALTQLTEAVTLCQKRELSPLEAQGLIQAFEFTHELAWNIMKDYFYYQGNSSITGSRDATRESFSKHLIEDGEGWMSMISSRNKTSHTYNEQVALEIVNHINQTYHRLFMAFEIKMSHLAEKV